jgi:hypothetical protein
MLPKIIKEIDERNKSFSFFFGIFGYKMIL